MGDCGACWCWASAACWNWGVDNNISVACWARGVSSVRSWGCVGVWAGCEGHNCWSWSTDIACGCDNFEPVWDSVWSWWWATSWAVLSELILDRLETCWAQLEEGLGKGDVDAQVDIDSGTSISRSCDWTDSYVLS